MRRTCNFPWYGKLVAALCLCCCLRSSGAVRVKETAIECAADAWLEMQSSNAARVNGSGQELHLLNSRKLILLAFRTVPIAGWQIQNASLMLHVRSGLPPGRIEVSVRTEDWSEAETRLRFTPPRNAITCDVVKRKGGWIEVKFAPQFVEAIAAGRGHGLVIGGRGSKEECVFDSRESVRFAPYIAAEGVKLP